MDGSEEHKQDPEAGATTKERVLRARTLSKKAREAAESKGEQEAIANDKREKRSRVGTCAVREQGVSESSSASRNSKRRRCAAAAEEVEQVASKAAVEHEALTLYQPWLKQVEGRTIEEGVRQDLEGVADGVFLTKAASFRGRLFTKLPPAAREAFVAATLPALQAMVGALQTENQPLFARALQAFEIVPQFTLVQDSDRRISGKVLASKIFAFSEGRVFADKPAEHTRQNMFLDTETEQQKAVRKATQDANEGHLRRAAQKLESVHSGLRGIVQPTPDVVAKLRQLHPEGGDAAPDVPDGAPKGLSMSRARLRRAGRKIANGSAADVFGWTGELMGPLLHDRRCVSYLLKILEFIRDGLVGGEAREWLLASWLIALDKGNDKIRPIAGSNILFKLVATYLMDEGGAAARELFRDAGVQFGVFTADGVVGASRLTQMVLEADPKHIVLKTDFQNAFNVIPRKLMLDKLFAQPSLSCFFRLVHWAYHRPSSLFVRGVGGVVAVIRSRQGVKQGCIFGSFGYSIATLDMFKQIRSSREGCSVVAILDDLSMVGPPEEVFPAFDALRKLAEETNIPIQLEKCEVLEAKVGPTAFFDSELERLKLKRATGYLPMLGTVVGWDGLGMSQWFERKVKSWEPTLRLLESEDVPAQLSVLLARFLATARPNFLSRSLPPMTTHDPLLHHDKAVRQCVEKRLDLSITGFSEFMFTLPMSRGGVGFTPAARAAAAAFLASVATTLPYLMHTSLAGTDIMNLPTIHAVRGCLDSLKSLGPDALPEECPSDAVDFVVKFRKRSSDAEKLQSKILQGITNDRVRRFFGSPENNPVNLALYTARSFNPLSAAPLKAYPLTSETVLTDNETRFLVAHATNCSLREMPSVCSCGAPLDLQHSTSCGPNVLARHNRVQGRFVAFAREQGCTVTQNPRLTVEDAAKKQEPDVVFYFGSGSPVETDITIVNPTATSNANRSAFPAAGATLGAAERKKKNKYGSQALIRGREFYPLAFETHGRTGKSVLKLLGRLAALTDGSCGLSVRDMLLDLHVNMVKGSAECARIVAARAMKAQNESRKDIARP